MVVSTGALAAAVALKKVIDDLYDLGKAQFKKELGALKFDTRMNSLYRKIRNVSKVKTIWQFEKEVDIKPFYYPTKLIIDGKECKVNKLMKLPYTRVVIQGIAGQGKSIYLRYLCVQELTSSEVVPVFIELRTMEKGEKLFTYIKSALKELGFDVSDDLTSFLMESGKIALLLDGFDEVKEDLVGCLINELEHLSKTYPSLRMIVTSRPDRDIAHSSFFRVFNIAPLKHMDLKPLVSKLVSKSDKERSLDFIQTVISDPKYTNILQILTTPLIVTLLVIHYKSQKGIPEDFSEFYEDLFHTLLTRHDKAKPGFIRPRKSDLSNRNLSMLFEAFCYFSRKNSETLMKEDVVFNIAEEASDAIEIPVEVEDFIEDIAKITCLIVKEGKLYSFLHKTVQEFHAARYIKNRPDNIDFYDAMIQKDLFSVWKQEIEFLKYIDAYRCTKHFFLPDIERSISQSEDFFGGVLDSSVVTLTDGSLSIIHWKNLMKSYYFDKAFEDIMMSLLNPVTIFKRQKGEGSKEYSLREYIKITGTEKQLEKVKGQVCEHLQKTKTDYIMRVKKENVQSSKSFDL